MTYAEALAIRAKLEASLLEGGGVHSVTLGDHTVTYQSERAARAALSQVNRDILAYERRTSNINPSRVRPRWR